MTPEGPADARARPDWHQYFMAVAKLIASRSTCNSRPTGAVIVKDKHILATGYNGAPAGAPHCLGETAPDGQPYCHSRHMGAGEQAKYNFCRSAHAEANAVAQAARLGAALAEASIYTTLAPCYVCAKLLAATRIRHVYYEREYESADRERDAYWRSMFREAGGRTWEKVTLDTEAVALFTRFLSHPTSERRLGVHST